MKKLIFIIVIFFSSNTYALPSCPSDKSQMWNNCIATETYPSGDRYIGEWKDNKKNGKGTYIFVQGGEYIGDWKDDNSNGQGTFTYSSGEKYTGEWKDGKAFGKGTFSYAGGEKYVGDWKDGALHGQGVFTNRNGKKYIGGWKEGEYVPAICKNMGLEKGTKSYENCVLKLIKEINIDN